MLRCFAQAGPIKNLAAMMELAGPMQKGDSNLWPDLMAHPNYDEFWKSRGGWAAPLAPAWRSVGGQPGSSQLPQDESDPASSGPNPGRNVDCILGKP